nr:hypothetical protein [Tanacetum cinerariifolium]
FFIISSIAVQTPGSGISNLLVVGTTFTGSGNNIHWQWELILPVGTLSWQWECLANGPGFVMGVRDLGSWGVVGSSRRWRREGITGLGGKRGYRNSTLNRGVTGMMVYDFYNFGPYG